MIRVLLADDHDVVRRGLRDLLEEHAEWQVCGEARNGREAVEMAVQLRPDIAVLDLSMPELNGLEATRQIRKQLPNTEVLIFSMHESDQFVREVLAAGARGYVLKSDAARQLSAAVESLSHHQPFFTGKVSEALLEAFLRSSAKGESDEPPFGVLTAREREIVQLLAEGQNNRHVATKLTISVKTVETHRAAIMRKLGVSSIVELVHYALRNGLIEP